MSVPDALQRTLIVQQEDEDDNFGEELFPCDNPRHPEMRSLQSRIKSFRESESVLPSRCSPQALAEAGYFLDLSNEVKCWYCGCSTPTLQEGSFGRDIWLEHAKYQPECEYVLREKGIVYVEEAVSQNVIASYPTTTRRSPPRSSAAVNDEFMNPNPSNVDIYPRPNWQRDSYGMGGSTSATVFTAPGIQITTINNPQPSTAHNINLITPSGHMTQNISVLSQPGYVAMTQSNLQENPSPVVREALEMGFSPQRIQDAMSRQILRSGQVHLTTEELINDITDHFDEGSPGRSSNRSPSRSETMPSKVSETANEKSSLQRVEDLPSASAYSAPSKCVVCDDEEAEILFLPCSHLITCAKCSSLLVYCPACDVAVEQWIQVNRNPNS